MFEDIFTRKGFWGVNIIFVSKLLIWGWCRTVNLKKLQRHLSSDQMTNFVKFEIKQDF